MPGSLTRDAEAGELHVTLTGIHGPEFHDLKAKIKDIPGRRWDPDKRVWVLPDEPQVAEKVLLTLEPEHTPDIEEYARSYRQKVAGEVATTLPEDASLEVPWAHGRAPWQPEFIYIGDQTVPFKGLMQHQRPVVDLVASARKLLVCDDMGLGKSGEGVSGIEEWRLRNALGAPGAVRTGFEYVKHEHYGVEVPEGPKLITAPNSVTEGWVDELNLWLGKDAPLQVIDATNAKAQHNQLAQAIKDNLWIVTNWEKLRAKKQKDKVKLQNGNTKPITVWTPREPLFEFPWAVDMDLTDWTPNEVRKARQRKSPGPGWLAIISDEIHRAKNRKSQTAQGLYRVRADQGVMLGLSGTPLMNSPDELWSLLHWLWPEEYTSYWAFYEMYVDYTEGYFGKIITGVKNPEALRFELRQRLVRRTRGQVLDLPGKFRIPVPVKLNKGQRKLYDEATKKMWLEIEQDIKAGSEQAKRFKAAIKAGATPTDLVKLPNGAARFVRQRQIIETPANLGGPDDSAVLDACVDRILDSRPEQWIVFTEFKPTIRCLAERLDKHGLVVEAYDGDVDAETRGKLKRRFQAGEIDVLVGTIQAMYQGITLTAGNQQFWCSRSPVPDINEQGEDRQDRIGQQRKVAVHIALAEDTVATGKVEPINRKKERIVRTVIPKDDIEGGPSA